MQVPGSDYVLFFSCRYQGLIMSCSFSDAGTRVPGSDNVLFFPSCRYQGLIMSCSFPHAGTRVPGSDYVLFFPSCRYQVPGSDYILFFLRCRYQGLIMPCSFSDADTRVPGSDNVLFFPSCRYQGLIMSCSFPHVPGSDNVLFFPSCRYQGPLLDDGSLDSASSGGATSPEFTKLCAWLTTELRLYCRLEENVHATNCPSEAAGFQLEMSGLLSELNCPYPVLTTGDLTQRFLHKNHCLLLLSFLISELEASRMSLVNCPQSRASDSGKALDGSPVFQELKGICVSLGMSKPPANITMFQFFTGIEKKLKEALNRVPPNHVGEPLLKKPLGPVHLEKIEAINQALVNEYEVRRKMLLKRLDVTVQSFGWSDRAKEIRALMLEKGFDKPWTILRSKWKNLKQRYMAEKRQLSRSGAGGKKTFKYFDLIDLILGNRPIVAAITSVINSSGESQKFRIFITAFVLQNLKTSFFFLDNTENEKDDDDSENQESEADGEEVDVDGESANGSAPRPTPVRQHFWSRSSRSSRFGEAQAFFETFLRQQDEQAERDRENIQSISSNLQTALMCFERCARASERQAQAMELMAASRVQGSYWPTPSPPHTSAPHNHLNPNADVSFPSSYYNL
ncbi:hypothetical protein WMY93_018416 [Mugilogobius chulae]|uniref:Family with sequence similarity 98 member A n=1 Tax=Mugilogobius chulae TaxID=88201 RepID=A0AAW0NNN0_9GOBI